VRQNGEIEITRIAYGDVMRTAWRMYTGDIAICLVAWLTAWVCTLVLFGILRTIFVASAMPIASLGLGDVGLYLFFGMYVLSLVFLICYFAFGLLQLSLNVARGASTQLSTIFKAAPFVLSGSVVLLVTFLGTAVGLLLLVVPGVLCAVLLTIAPIALVDRSQGALPALKLSVQVMSRNLLPAFLLLFPVMFVGNIVSALTCGLGGLLILPFQMLLATTIYLRATGQPTAYDAPVET
jgi:uncharacterized membrane protein